MSRTGLLRSCAALALAAAFVPALAARAAPADAPVLAFVEAPDQHPALGAQPLMALAPLDPRTLRPLAGPRVAVGTGGCASRYGGEECWGTPPYAFAPGHAELAVAGNDALGSATVRLIDPARMRLVAAIPIAGGAVGALAWLSADRVLAVQEVCCSGAQRLLVIDVGRRSVSARRELDGSVVRIARTGRDLVLLLSPPGAIGPARLAVVDARGGVRFVALGGIAAGTRWISDHSLTDIEIPGLAVDPRAGGVAYVVTPTTVAAVDLARLRVGYHAIGGAGAAKAADGDLRTAVWLGGGRLAVSGEHDSYDGRTGAWTVSAAGLTMIDTGSWSVRTLEVGATTVAAAGGMLLASGGGWSSTAAPGAGIGLAVFGATGALRYRLFAGAQAMPATAYRGLAQVIVVRGSRTRTITVDLRDGRVATAAPHWPPGLLSGAAGGWWDTVIVF